MMTKILPLAILKTPAARKIMALPSLCDPNGLSPLYHSYPAESVWKSVLHEFSLLYPFDQEKVKQAGRFHPHGLIDYAFAIALFTIPGMIGSDKNTRRLYKLVTTEVFLYGALSKQPLALKGLIPFKIHEKIDILNLIGLSLLTAFKGIRKHPATLAFHIGTTFSGLASVLLTKWRHKRAE